MLTKIKFALAAALTIALTSAAAAMINEDPANILDHRYPHLAVVQPSKAGLGAFARAEAPRKPELIIRSQKAWEDRATGRGW